MNDTANTETTTPVTASRPKQNGQVRPTPGTRTGLVWDYADALMAKREQLQLEHKVPLVSEVKDLYRSVADAQDSTAQTQYGRWIIYHDLRDALKARRAAEKPTKPGDEEKAKAREEKKAAREKAKAEKDAAKTEKTAAREKAKADKLAEKERKAAEKQAAKEAAAAAAAEEARKKAEEAAERARVAAENAAKAAADAAAG